MVIHSIIVAAGSGSRFGGPLPKQFLPLDGIPVAMRAVQSLRNALPGCSDSIVLSSSEMERWKHLCNEHGFSSPRIVAGGKTRFESVRNALAELQPDVDVVLVHDGARPFPSPEMIERIIGAFVDAEIQGVIPAIPVTDSLRVILPAGKSESVDRSLFRAVQTPQAFRCGLLKKAYAAAVSPDGFTDDASVMEAAGYTKLKLVDGDPVNFKITNPRDLSIASALLP